MQRRERGERSAAENKLRALTPEGEVDFVKRRRKYYFYCDVPFRNDGKIHSIYARFCLLIHSCNEKVLSLKEGKEGGFIYERILKKELI